ncbi:hypothetical protein [Motilibacter aurantiacus]|uniref:hypothetical protein n=1 Tax=Motilibacter aurantiacus TaxID=2714955 RepID=UPI00140AAC07|nr:hypothetical protein [Motilibacter aurantiacus]NHC47146.1 hypothetical protein [Motilibacter aurantiacus]
MLTYGDGIRELCASMSLLVASGPPTPAQRLTVSQTERAAAARDAIVGEVRGLAVSLTQLQPDTTVVLSPEHLVTHPAHVMTRALRELPKAGDPDGTRAPSELLGRNHDPLTAAWTNAGRSAVSLERWNHAIARLSGDAAWSALRDVAELADCIPYLDEDLAMQSTPDVSERLRSPISCASLRLAVQQLRQQTAGLPAAGYLDGLPTTATPEVVVVRGPADIADATRRMTAVLAARGPNIPMDDVVAAAELLLHGVHMTARVATRRFLPAEEARVVEEFKVAVDPLREAIARQGQTVTLSKGDVRVRHLGYELYKQLRQVGESGETADLMRNWLREVPSLALAVRGGLVASGAAGRLLERADYDVRAHGRVLHWVKVTPAQLHHLPLLRVFGAVTEKVTAAARRLPSERAADHATPEGCTPGIPQLRHALFARELRHPPKPLVVPREAADSLPLYGSPQATARGPARWA